MEQHFNYYHIWLTLDKRNETMGTCISAHIISLLYLTSCGFRVFQLKVDECLVLPLTAEASETGPELLEQANVTVRDEQVHRSWDQRQRRLLLTLASGVFMLQGSERSQDHLLSCLV